MDLPGSRGKIIPDFKKPFCQTWHFKMGDSNNGDRETEYIFNIWRDIMHG